MTRSCRAGRATPSSAMNEAEFCPALSSAHGPTLAWSALGIRLVQVPVGGAELPAGCGGLGRGLDLPLEPARPRFFPLPTRLRHGDARLATWMADAVAVPQGETVAAVTCAWPRAGSCASTFAPGWRRRSGLRAGRRPAARPASQAPGVLELPRAGPDFDGHRYLAVLRSSRPVPASTACAFNAARPTPGSSTCTEPVLRTVLARPACRLVSAYVSRRWRCCARSRRCPACASTPCAEASAWPGWWITCGSLRDDAGARQMLRHDPGFDPRREAILGGLASPRGWRPRSRGRGARRAEVSARRGRPDRGPRRRARLAGASAPPGTPAGECACGRTDHGARPAGERGANRRAPAAGSPPRGPALRAAGLPRGPRCSPAWPAWAFSPRAIAPAGARFDRFREPRASVACFVVRAREPPSP